MKHRFDSISIETLCGQASTDLNSNVRFSKFQLTFDNVQKRNCWWDSRIIRWFSESLLQIKVCTRMLYCTICTWRNKNEQQAKKKIIEYSWLTYINKRINGFKYNCLMTMTLFDQCGNFSKNAELNYVAKINGCMRIRLFFRSSFIYSWEKCIVHIHRIFKLFIQ